jgi:hypothetical protein
LTLSSVVRYANRGPEGGIRAVVQIRGIDGLTLEDIEEQVAAGHRFVFYEFCISLVIATLRKPSAIHFLKPGELGVLRGLPYTLVSLLLGWWGVPWGIIYTPLTLVTNFSGGRDITEKILDRLRHEAAAPAP